jgi:hypothetical protein
MGQSSFQSADDDLDDVLNKGEHQKACEDMPSHGKFGRGRSAMSGARQREGLLVRAGEPLTSIFHMVTTPADRRLVQSRNLAGAACTQEGFLI